MIVCKIDPIFGILRVASTSVYLLDSLKYPLQKYQVLSDFGI